LKFQEIQTDYLDDRDKAVRKGRNNPKSIAIPFYPYRIVSKKANSMKDHKNPFSLNSILTCLLQSLIAPRQSCLSTFLGMEKSRELIVDKSDPWATPLKNLKFRNLQPI